MGTGISFFTGKIEFGSQGLGITNEKMGLSLGFRQNVDREMGFGQIWSGKILDSDRHAMCFICLRIITIIL